MMKQIAVFTSAMLLAATVNAEDACENPRNSYDATYCVAKLFVESDKELNVVYQDLHKALSDSDKKNLLAAQRKWLKFRNNACEADGSIDVECNYNVNKERTDALRDRLRECNTGHCRSDLIGKGDWHKP